MSKKNIIYLTGFMASGKSTIGPILGNVLGWEFYDLDKVIEKKENKKVVDIFEMHGEEYFRKIEHEALFELSLSANVVIALGGGTISQKRNLEIIKNSGILVYLKATPGILYKRLKNKIDRPLFKELVLGEKSEDEFLEKIDGLLKKREDDYEQADLVINTDQTRIGVTVDKIAKQIKSLLNEKS
ncbi:MAG TPA: shikimate kinase [Ignavibacteria bacterium]|nr:shikimate kinase [Ignavibacteria bacterium]